MIKLNQWSKIRAMHKAGKKIKGIARELGLSKNTVRKYIKQESYEKYKRKEVQDKLITPYEDMIKSSLEKELIGTRIFNDIKKQGYTGSYRTLARTIKDIKPTIDNKTTVRFETEPGEQAQFDWSPYKIDIAGEITNIYCFLFILAFSRYKAMTFSKDQTVSSVIGAMEYGLRTIGGVPGSIVIDNAKQLIISHTKDEIQFHQDLLFMSGAYQFTPYACQPYRPRTKGKVERPFFYVENHFVKGNSFASFDELNKQGKAFIDSWNMKPHSTTLVPPVNRFEDEKPFLRSLPSIMYSPTMKETRKVSWDCLISVHGIRYSVPYQYAGKTVLIRISQGETLEVYSEKKELIAQHTISSQKGGTVINNDHYKGMKGSIPRSLPKLRETLIQTFPSGQAFMQLLEKKNVQNNTYLLQKVLELTHSYEIDVLEMAISKSVEYERYDYEFLKNILKNSPRKEHEYKTDRGFPKNTTDTRSLSYYGKILH